MKKVLLIWLLVLCTLVPYAGYYLLFQADTSQYPALIIFILFWVFGFWTIVGPWMTAIRVKRLINQLQSIQSLDHLKALWEQSEAEDTIIETIAQENGIPTFIARRVFNSLRKQITQCT